MILATIPIGILGLLFKDQIRTTGRNLWLVATVLIVFAVVFWVAKYSTKERSLEQLTLKDGLVMGSAQCLALIPGVSVPVPPPAPACSWVSSVRPHSGSRSLLAIPAVTASGLFSLPDAFSPSGEGMEASGPQLLVATLVAFVIGYASIAWLLQFVSKPR